MVDRDTVIRWAREMGAWTASTSELEKLAGRAYDAALEQAAQKCEELAGDWRQHPLCQAMGESCAAAIRSLKSQQPGAVHSARADDEGSTGRRSVASRAKAQVLSDFSHAYKVMGVEPGNIMKALAPTGGERLTPFRPIDYITDDETLEAYVQERIRMAAIGESKT